MHWDGGARMGRLLVTWALSAPVMQIPTLHASRHVSVLAMVWVMLNVVLIGVEVWAVRPWECEPGPSYPPPTTPRLLIAASSMAYAFGGHGMCVDNCLHSPASSRVSAPRLSCPKQIHQVFIPVTAVSLSSLSLRFARLLVLLVRVCI